MEPLIETWNISAGLNEYLLNSLAEPTLVDVAVTRGRNVAEQFAHLHNVRLMWLNAAAPELHAGQTKLEKGLSLSKDVLLKNLQSSKAAMAKLLQSGLESGRIKGFKPHPQAFLGYLIAHEAHHRGQILQTLKQNGHLPDKKILFGLWEWGTPK